MKAKYVALKKHLIDEEEIVTESMKSPKVVRHFKPRDKGYRNAMKKVHPSARVKRSAKRAATSPSKRAQLEKLWKEWDSFYEGMPRWERLYMAGDKNLMHRMKHPMTMQKAYEVCQDDVVEEFNEAAYDGCECAEMEEMFGDVIYRDDDCDYFYGEDDDVVGPCLEQNNARDIENVIMEVESAIRMNPIPTYREWIEMMTHIWDNHFGK